MAKFDDEFQEIAHCGGRFTVTIDKDEQGNLGYQIGYRLESVYPASLFAIYALPEGIPAGTVQLGGIGDPWNPPPHRSCYGIMIGSDRTAMFGHWCHQCQQYWRSRAAPNRWAMTCPYCGLVAECHHFRTAGQLAYIEECCTLLSETLSREQPGEYAVNMDEVADRVQEKADRPGFYYVEEKQQNMYNCDACGEVNDILGRFGYCSCCGTRNDYQIFGEVIEELRERVRSQTNLPTCVKDTVGAFDSLARSYARQLADRVPMTPRRQKEWKRSLFHSFEPMVTRLQDVFDIDILRGSDKERRTFGALMFNRRHVYEHNGGEVDQKYIDDSGDTSVKLKQMLRETPDTVLRIKEIASKMAENLHSGFHQIFPPQQTPIRMQQQRAKRRQARQKLGGS